MGGRSAKFNLALTACATAPIIFSFLMSLVVTLRPDSAEAELRAYRLKITNASTGTDRFVVSRFDHIQYPQYHYVRTQETVSLDQTWMCYERSDFAETLCSPPAPTDTGQGRGPASTKP